MKTIVISKNESDQRLDKFLLKYFNNTGSGFVYKMLRKKNFKLNGLKASGNELLKENDQISIYLSDETHDKMHRDNRKKKASSGSDGKLDIVYEDEHVLIVNKPTGLLSQSDDSKDPSLNDMVREYVISNADDTLLYRAFKPGICNRLDRNTSGLIICAKTYAAANNLSYLIKKKKIKRFYYTVVSGELKGEDLLEGRIVKDKDRNFVHYSDKRELKEGMEVCLRYKSLKHTEEFSLIEVELITGRSHQIRVQFSAVGHPVLGDGKYGNLSLNKELKLKSQLLSACKLVFPVTKEPCLKSLSDKTIEIEMPKRFKRFIK